MVGQRIRMLLGPNSQLANQVLTFHELFPSLDACVFWLDMFCCIWTYLWFCFWQQSFSNLFFFPTYLQHRRVMDTGPIMDTTTILDDSYVSVSTYSIYSIHNIYSIYVQYLQYIRTISTYIYRTVSPAPQSNRHWAYRGHNNHNRLQLHISI